MQSWTCVVGPQFRDFILKLQLSPFHFSQFQLILRWMRQFLRNFFIKCVVTLSKRA